MSRIPMVTRTIQTTTVKALCVDVDKQWLYSDEFVLSGTYKDDKSLLKALESVEDEGHKIVHVVSSDVVETLYGMTEQEFVSTAKKMPPRGTKND